MTPWHHALSSAKKFGGKPQDYMQIHEWFDSTKQYTGDWTHRAMRHHAAGIQWCIDTFGDTFVIEGKHVPVKLIAEQHVEEDCGFIPTIQDWLAPLKDNPPAWALKVKVKNVSELQVAEDR
jgi:hypothetical protein